MGKSRSKDDIRLELFFTQFGHLNLVFFYFFSFIYFRCDVFLQSSDSFEQMLERFLAESVDCKSFHSNQKHAFVRSSTLLCVVLYLRPKWSLLLCATMKHCHLFFFFLVFCTRYSCRNHLFLFVS